MRYFMVAVPETPEEAESPLAGTWELAGVDGGMAPVDEVPEPFPRPILHVVKPC